MRPTFDLRRLRGTTALLTVPALLWLAVAAPAHANPQGGKVVAGSATIQQNGSTVTVTQGSNRAIVNWNAFSIASGELTRFLQPGSSAAILNRVMTADPSSLMGQLQSNGRVYLVNPNGILIGPGAHIDVGAFIASTRNVTDQSFLAGGDMPFLGSSLAGVTNLGMIDARTGEVTLLGQNVLNAGTINAPLGTVTFAAGTDLLLKASGPDAVLVRAGSGDGTGTGVANQGVINAAAAALKAAGGNVYALAVNNSGAIQATGLANQGGRILLTSDGGAVENSGSLAAQNADGNGGAVVMDAGAGRASLSGGSIDVSGRRSGTVGGTATVTGAQVALEGAARIAADGDAGGGTIKIGGGAHGADPTVANAQQTFVGSDVTLSANAGYQGNGGAITVWSDQQTYYAGQASARGGSAGGNGGHAEVSSKGTLGYNGMVDLRAPSGATGSLLLDPSNLTIVSGASGPGITQAGGFFSDGNNLGNQTVSAATIMTQLGLSSVTVSTFSTAADAGDLTVAAPITWASNNTLTLAATRNLKINSTISGASLNLFASGVISEASGASVTAGSVLFGAQSTGSSINMTGSFTASTVSFLTGSAAKFSSVIFLGATASDKIKIGTIDFGSAPSFFTGTVLVDNRASTTGLTVKGSIGSASDVTLLTGGDLTLASGTSLTPSLFVTLDAEGGHFVNNAGAGVFSTNGSQVPTRFVIYSQDSGGSTNTGGLTGTSLSGVSFPSDPRSGNVFYLSSGGSPPITTVPPITTIPATVPNGGSSGSTSSIGSTDTTNIARSSNSCTAANPCVTVGSTTGLTSPATDPQQTTFNANATDFMSSMSLNLIQQNWSATGGGYDQATVEQYALALCEQTASAASCAANPGPALIAVMNDLQNGSLSEDAILTWSKLRSASGWGSPVLTFGTGTAINPAVNAMLSSLWQSAVSPQNIGSTSVMLSGMLSQLHPGDPGYGESLATALANLGNPNDSVTQGLQISLLMLNASTISQKQANGLALTPAEQSFANALSTQMLQQQKATLTQVSADFQAVQQNNAPKGTNLGTLFYYGTEAPAALQNELTGFVPGSATSPASFNNAATTAVRMVTALGRSVQQTGTTNTNSTVATSSTALSVSVAASGIAIGAVVPAAAAGAAAETAAGGASMSALTAAMSSNAATATAAPSAGAASADAASAASAVSVVGPVAIGAAAAAILVSAAVQVADIQKFTNTLSTETALVNAQLGQAIPPTLNTLQNQTGANTGTALMFYCLTEMVTGTGVQRPNSITQ